MWKRCLDFLSDTWSCASDVALAAATYLTHPANFPAVLQDLNRTFKQCAEAYIKTHRAGWHNAKHAAQDYVKAREFVGKGR
jgi:hypothetical protein